MGMRTILIVDNEPLEISVLREMLEEASYQFETALTGAEARRIVRSKGARITAILIDWILPDVEGIELLTWMQTQPQLSDVEVVVHSAEFDPGHVHKAIEAGAYYYLTKPFDEPQLEAIIRAAVASFELKKRLFEKSKAVEDAFGLLKQGNFQLRTFDEAELLATHIASACGRPEDSMGLAELMLNAIEHGNLAISYEEKGKLLAKRQHEKELRRRLALPEYRDRYVEVTIERVPGTLVVRIKDQGPGFDFERYMTLDKKRLFDSHGRGVLMATATLDLSYIPPGNVVEVRLPVEA
jgi:CheY-like chemotaxis protein